jgi:hypothetical protein
MKMKYTAVVALGAWLLVTGWLASMVIAKPAVLRMGNQAEDSAAMAELRNSIARNRKAMEGIESLRGASLPYLARGTLIALPVAGSGTLAAGLAGATASEIAAGGLPPPPEPQLSMVLDAGGRRVALFNDEQVRPGSRLADGGRVLAIGPDWISVRDRTGKRATYRVRSPFVPVSGGERL